MQVLSKGFSALVAMEHIYILVLEMFLWQTEYAMKRFGTTPDFAAESHVLAMNQGLYNGFLAAGLIWALVFLKDRVQFQVLCFFLGCVVVAGIFGGATAKPAIFFIQAVPALIALVLVILANRNHQA